MLHISEIKNNPAVFEQAKKLNLLNKKWFVFNSFSDELIGAFDSFDEAMNANLQWVIGGENARKRISNLYTPNFRNTKT